MTIAFVIVTVLYLAIASLVAMNSVFEAERPVLAAKDLVVIALVSVAWPAVGCALLVGAGVSSTFPRKHGFLPAIR